MSNNFVRVGNLSGDAVLDGGAEKIHFESVLGGVGDPSGAPDPDSKTWLYVDKSQDPVALWVWDPGPARWNRTGDGGAGGDVHSPMAPVLGGEPAQFADNTGKLLAAAAVNVVNGLMRLDGNAEVPESFIPSTIARDTEVTSAISTHSAATDPHGDRGYTDAQIAAINAAAVGARPDSWVPAWSEVTSKPTEFPPSAHTHPQSDVTGLVSDLAAKVADTDPRLSDARTPLTHTHSLVGLSDVDDTGVGDGDTLVYDGGLWVPGALRDPLFGRIRQFTGNSTGGPGPYALTTTPADIPHSFISGSWVSDFSPPDLLVGRRYQATVQFSIGADDPGVQVGAQLVTADNLKIFRVLYNGLVSGMNDVVIPFLLSVSNVNYQTLRLQVLSPTGAAVTVRCVWRQGHTVAVNFRAVDIGPIPT